MHQTLPKPEDLIRLESVDREILLARLEAERRRRKRLAIRAAIDAPDSIDWIENNVYNAQTVNIHANDYSRASKIVLEPFQKRILRHLLTINPKTGRFPYRTIVYSAPKKSGKTTFGTCFSTYYASNIESPNAVYVLANDREQSAGRVFAFAIPTLKALGGKPIGGKFAYLLPNGTIFQALTSDPDKEAGGSYGLTVWDELWAYKSERARLLFDELMPISTRTNSMRLIVTYAGFEDTSDLLLSLYLKIFRTTEETEVASGCRPVPGLEDIVTHNSVGDVIPTCYETDSGLFYFNDHEARMSWQRGEAGAALRAETEDFLTETNVYRLMQNRWQMTENPFVKTEIVQKAINKDIKLSSMTFGIDASMRHDNTALVGVYEKNMRYVTGFARSWAPRGVNIDIEETVIEQLLQLYRMGLVARRVPKSTEVAIINSEGLIPIDVHYDPFQMHQVAMNLRKRHKLLMAEFPQGKERLLSDTFLQQQYESLNIDIPDDAVLLSHLESAKAETQTDEEPKIRIVKATGTHARPIDLIVAQSMAVYRCSQRARRAVGGLVQGVAKGW